ncbi:MAG: hypothetical protein WKF89_06150 [Chitinophagaceae bacterium]
MKTRIIYFLAISAVLLFACKTKTYEWENFSYTAVPVVKVNTSKSAFPTVSTANTTFFNLSEPNLVSQQFEFTLNWEGFGLAEVTTIDVYLGFNLAETSPPAYPILISQPGGLYPDRVQYPLPSRVGSGDKLYQSVTTFPATISLTAAQLAAFTGTNLATVKQNDYFLFKFIVKLKDGRQIVGFQENVCDETRGEIGDCRVGVRFRRP